MVDNSISFAEGLGCKAQYSNEWKLKSVFIIFMMMGNSPNISDKSSRSCSMQEYWNRQQRILYSHKWIPLKQQAANSVNPLDESESEEELLEEATKFQRVVEGSSILPLSGFRGYLTTITPIYKGLSYTLLLVCCCLDTALESSSPLVRVCEPVQSDSEEELLEFLEKVVKLPAPLEDGNLHQIICIDPDINTTIGEVASINSLPKAKQPNPKPPDLPSAQFKEKASVVKQTLSKSAQKKLRKQIKEQALCSFSSGGK
ncbi:hypothetical protein RHSIM_Rhsim12G0101700 [Rhododendron simsii]|uniref:Uncharacterized protein n=1 Tax=Rhododendron simsii TaxID=118357 RepID=A0A834L6M7_RHOSS|nr:hypothetical protein RHSIM_Rhsim12G0101700 [Rhododendron simsii]